MNRENLAIYRFKDRIVETVKNNNVVVIEAPTGSGKTTQIPQILFDAALNGQGIIGVTQPRRIAACGVSNRIAYEMDVELGRLVGYKIRFEDFTSPNTKIKIMTDGILLEELRSDFLLSKYSIVIVDEAHERSLNIDFILGLLKDILRERPDFKVVVSSATINAKLFSDYFDGAPIISVETKPFPIEIKYRPLKKKEDYEEMQSAIFGIVENIVSTNQEGDILIFLPGEDSIKDCCRRLEAINADESLEILPLYARLGIEEQNKVFNQYKDKRKIVIATNIAETSITIDGIIFVIDPGYSKINYYNPRTFTSFLEVKPISKASCDQRKGRAGRTAPGVVFRLYGEDDYNSREEYTKEEIYRTDLSEVVLRMADIGIYNYERFDFISQPNRGAIKSAVETLVSIGALNDSDMITDVGKMMVVFPLTPRLSRILIEGIKNYQGILNNLVVVISFLSAKSPFLYPAGEEIESRNAQKKLSIKGGDFFSWINLFHKYNNAKDKEEFVKRYYLDIRTMKEIINIHNQLISMISEKDNVTVGNDYDYNQIIKCICAGLKQYICLRNKKSKGNNNNYYSATEKEIRIHPGSFLYGTSPDWIVGGEIVNTGRTYIRTAAMVPESIIKEAFFDLYDIIANKKDKVKKFLREEQTSTKVKEKFVDSDKILILDKYFDIVGDKKVSYALIPYNVVIQLKSRKEKVLKYNFDNLQAVLTYGESVILKDKLNSLLQYFDKIDLDNGINKRWPKGRTFYYPQDWTSLFRFIKILLKPTFVNKKSKNCGFLTITENEKDQYKFYLEKDFFTAIEKCLEVVERIFSSELAVWNDHEKEILESIHHKLNKLSEEMDV